MVLYLPVKIVPVARTGRKEERADKMDKVDPLANSKAHPHTFSAIISDIMLGKMDGFALSASATEASTRRYTMSNWVNTGKRSKT